MQSLRTLDRAESERAIDALLHGYDFVEIRCFNKEEADQIRESIPKKYRGRVRFRWMESKR